MRSNSAVQLTSLLSSGAGPQERSDQDTKNENEATCACCKYAKKKPATVETWKGGESNYLPGPSAYEASRNVSSKSSTNQNSKKCGRNRVGRIGRVPWFRSCEEKRSNSPD